MTSLISACKSLATDSRYAKKTRALASSLADTNEEAMTVKRLGPFHFDHTAWDGVTDFSGVSGFLEFGADLAAGAVVVTAYTVTTDPWNADVPVPVFVYLFDTGAGPNGSIFGSDLQADAPSSPTYKQVNQPMQMVTVTGEGVHFAIRITEDTEAGSVAPTQGALDVYVLVLVPVG